MILWTVISYCMFNTNILVQWENQISEDTEKASVMYFYVHFRYLHVKNLWNLLWINSDTTYCALLQTNISPAHHLIWSHIVFECAAEVSAWTQCVLMQCGRALCSVWRADSWAPVWVSPTLPSQEQASALTPPISLTLMDTCSLCAWQDGLLRKFNKNGNSDWIDMHTQTPQTPQTPTPTNQTCTYCD